MTPLRAKYIRDLTVRGRAQRTQRAYTRYVSELARYYQRSPELISYEEVTNWLYHLIKERQLSASVNVAVNAVRFLYGITLGRNTEALTRSVPHMKHPIERPEVYARSELEAILRSELPTAQKELPTRSPGAFRRRGHWPEARPCPLSVVCLRQVADGLRWDQLPWTQL
jgi:site-specific recombinase XerD